MLKSKKAMFVLLVSSIAFLISTIFLFANIEETRAGKDRFFGETSIDIVYMYYDAESTLLFIDYAAKYSLEHALRTIEGPIHISELGQRFDLKFKEYLAMFNNIHKTNLTLESYEFEHFIDEEKKEFNLIGISKQTISSKYKEDDITYKFKPNFHVKLKNFTRDITPDFEIEVEIRRDEIVPLI